RKDDTLQTALTKAQTGEKVFKANAVVSYELRDGILYRCYQDKRNNQMSEQLMVPLKLRPTVLLAAHDSVLSGHLATTRTVKPTTGRLLLARCVWRHQALLRVMLYLPQDISKGKESAFRRLSAGDKVLVLLPADHNKLLMTWRGPFEVVGPRGLYDYDVSVNDKSKTYHINMLRKFHERPRSATSVLHESAFPVGVGVVSMEEEMPGALVYVLVDKLGHTALVEHSIKLTSDTPINAKPYHIPHHMLEVVETEVRNVEDAGIRQDADIQPDGIATGLRIIAWPG
ncbi:hypothetical protein BaRGS_00016302, partial [Batillaria attramentaria]